MEVRPDRMRTLRRLVQHGAPRFRYVEEAVMPQAGYHAEPPVFENLRHGSAITTGYQRVQPGVVQHAHRGISSCVTRTFTLAGASASEPLLRPSASRRSALNMPAPRQRRRDLRAFGRAFNDASTEAARAYEKKPHSERLPQRRFELFKAAPRFTTGHKLGEQRHQPYFFSRGGSDDYGIGLVPCGDNGTMACFDSGDEPCQAPRQHLYYPATTRLLPHPNHALHVSSRRTAQ